MVGRRKKESYFQGVSISSGIAIGKPFFFLVDRKKVAVFSLTDKEIQGEINRYRKAIKKTQKEILKLQDALKQEGADEGAHILETYQQLLIDPSFTDEIESRLVKEKQNVEAVFQEAVLEYEKKFNEIPDKFFRERFKDVLDLSRRILDNLIGATQKPLSQAPKDAIIFAHDLGIADIAEVNSADIKAFVTESGGETSHAAIMARSRGIPYVANINFQDCNAISDEEVIVDGKKGVLVAHPSKVTFNRYHKLQSEVAKQEHFWSSLKDLKTETMDGYHIRLSANIETLDEVEVLKQFKGDSVGLFRSENLCLKENCLPSEEDQFIAYRELIGKLDGLPLVIRTFDVGGDKFLNVHSIPEKNPFLGCRAIRFMLKEKDVFYSQIRAILRASQFGRIGIMFPMISGLTELLEAKELIREVKESLEKEGVRFDYEMPVGCMVEVPSAAICADLLAANCDFLSIGTNDLVQYSLAVDRGNKTMSYLYKSSHPSILRLIKMVVNEGHRHGIPVSVCGEMAANPKFIALLLGLGVYELSVAPRYMPHVRHAIRNTHIVEAKRFADEVLTKATCEEVEELLNNAPTLTTGSV